MSAGYAPLSGQRGKQTRNRRRVISKAGRQEVQFLPPPVSPQVSKTRRGLDLSA